MLEIPETYRSQASVKLRLLQKSDSSSVSNVNVVYMKHSAVAASLHRPVILQCFGISSPTFTLRGCGRKCSFSDLQCRVSDRGIIMACWLDTGQATAVPNRAQPVRESDQCKGHRIPPSESQTEAAEKGDSCRTSPSTGSETVQSGSLWWSPGSDKWKASSGRMRSREALFGSRWKTCWGLFFWVLVVNHPLTQQRKSNAGQRLMKIPQEVQPRDTQENLWAGVPACWINSQQETNSYLPLTLTGFPPRIPLEQELRSLQSPVCPLPSWDTLSCCFTDILSVSVSVVLHAVLIKPAPLYCGHVRCNVSLQNLKTTSWSLSFKT